MNLTCKLMIYLTSHKIRLFFMRHNWISNWGYQISLFCRLMKTVGILKEECEVVTADRRRFSGSVDHPGKRYNRLGMRFTTWQVNPVCWNYWTGLRSTVSSPIYIDWFAREIQMAARNRLPDVRIIVDTGLRVNTHLHNEEFRDSMLHCANRYLVMSSARLNSMCRQQHNVRGKKK